MTHLRQGAHLGVTAALLVLLAACGVRGAPVPPDREVLIETGDGKTSPSSAQHDDDTRFPPPEAVN
ncbi:hypothetical protein [Pyruvatibacter sp.]|uniref:hypothetical protein n=1 Tax=Pyruvatibacter sp. TaxID=1981328 RepID=UPI0032EEC331